VFCVLFICVLIYLAFDLISVLVSGWEGNSSLGRLSQFIYKCMQITIIQKSSLLPILEAQRNINATMIRICTIMYMSCVCMCVILVFWHM